MKKNLTFFIIVIFLLFLFPFKSAASENNYEKIPLSDYRVNISMKGRVRWDETGIVSGGPIGELSFWGKKLALNDSMIKDGFIDTRDYGKIMVVPQGSGLSLKLTPSQKKKLMELKEK
jgi:hypothetical protein